VIGLKLCKLNDILLFLSSPNQSSISQFNNAHYLQLLNRVRLIVLITEEYYPNNCTIAKMDAQDDLTKSLGGQ